MAIGVILILAGGCNIFHLLPIGAVGIVGAILVISQNEYMQKRVNTWLNPESDRLGDGWQILQSLMTIGSVSYTHLDVYKRQVL